MWTALERRSAPVAGARPRRAFPRAHACFGRWRPLGSARAPPLRRRIGTAGRPAEALVGRLSVVRSARHRSLDVSLEAGGVCRTADGREEAGERQTALLAV